MSHAAKAAPPMELLPAEMLIGLILKREDTRSEALACHPGLLKSPFHRRLFHGARALHGAGLPVTALTLRAHLKSDPDWPNLPPDYLEILRLAAPVTKRVADVVQMLRDEWAAPSPDRTPYALKSLGTLRTTGSPEYLIKGLLAPEELSILYGEPGSGKSFLATWMAYRLSTGSSVFGRRTKIASVVYVALEGEVGFERRIQALRDTLGESGRFFWITEPADLFAGETDAEGLVAAVLQVDASLIIIDTFARAMGAGSENEGRDMAAMISSLDFIRRQTGAHVCVVHHSGKDVARGMRGHSSLLAATDVALEVKRDGDSRTVRVAKSKDGRDGDEHGFTLEVVDLGADDDGDPITTCLVAPAAAQVSIKSIGLTTTERGWLADLVDLFASGESQTASPASGFSPRPILTRDQVRDGLKSKGRFTLKPDGALTGADRQKLSAALNSLKDKGKVGMTKDHVWLQQERQ